MTADRGGVVLNVMLIRSEMCLRRATVTAILMVDSIEMLLLLLTVVVSRGQPRSCARVCAGV